MPGGIGLFYFIMWNLHNIKLAILSGQLLGVWCLHVFSSLLCLVHQHVTSPREAPAQGAVSRGHGGSLLITLTTLPFAVMSTA